MGKGELLMWTYNKMLQYPINLKCRNPRIAKVIISQYGGPDGAPYYTDHGVGLEYILKEFN